MTRSRFTIIDEQQPHEVAADVDAGGVHLDADAVAAALGWKLEQRGLCRGSTCIPIGGGELASSDQAAGTIDLAELAAHLDRPLALDLEHRVAALAAPSGERTRALATLEAPDFSLPDLQGRLHSLSEHRGKKILLIAHASW